MALRFITEPIVNLVGRTRADGAEIYKFLEKCNQEWPSMDDLEWKEELVVEAAGRQCYNSYSKGRPTSDWFKNVIEEGHTSVLRHASFTFAVAGVSRSLLQQIARHHHMDPSVLSQRFVDQSSEGVGLGFVVPPAMIDQYHAWSKLVGKQDPPEEEWTSPEVQAFDLWASSLDVALRAYENLRESLIKSGLKRKEANEAARSVLPECMETRFFISANGEGWLHYLHKRTSKGVDAEHKRLAKEFARQLKTVAPHIFSSVE